MGLGLGIDTGGTYTDSVIVALDSGRVLSKAKALTTRQDLVAGIESSIGQLDRDLARIAAPQVLENEVGLDALSQKRDAAPLDRIIGHESR